MPLDIDGLARLALGQGAQYLRGPGGTASSMPASARLRQIEPIFLDNHAARWTGDIEYTVMGRRQALRELGALFRRRDRPQGRRRPGQQARHGRRCGHGCARWPMGCAYGFTTIQGRRADRSRRHQGRDRDLRRRRRRAHGPEANATGGRSINVIGVDSSSPRASISRAAGSRT